MTRHITAETLPGKPQAGATLLLIDAANALDDRNKKVTFVTVDLSEQNLRMKGLNKNIPIVRGETEEVLVEE